MAGRARAKGALVRVAVAGATGRMGREVLQAVRAEPDLALVGAVARRFSGPAGPRELPLEGELNAAGVPTFPDVAACLRRVRPDVLVEFTSAAIAPDILRACVEARVHVVSGTTGMDPAVLKEIGAAAEARDLGAVVVPNFSLGATVLSLLVRTAAPYFKTAEIIELHHDKKRDAPSGTALALARTVGQALARPARPEDGPHPVDEDQPSRGLAVHGIPVHSVRLEGLVAHHEVIFASTGETLSLRHDSTSRACFMPGVLLAVRNVRRCKGLVTSLERLLEIARPDPTGL